MKKIIKIIKIQLNNSTKNSKTSNELFRWKNKGKAGGEINLSPGSRLQSGRTGSGPGPLITIGSLLFRIRKQMNTDFDFFLVCV